MDAKSLAKSKRAHSLQHSKKPRSIQKLKAPSTSPGDAANVNKPSGKQVSDKERPFKPRLPSNWDRYGEELDLDSVELSVDRANEKADVALPKSKGADYSHLIAEAQSHSLSDSCASGFPSLEDVLPGDFMDGLGSMLSVMGESILSWTGDDNFVVDDGAAASHETSFLSLNLDALAEQLEKVDISERLFIEADLIPPELRICGSRASSNPALDQKQATCESEAVMRTSGELTSKEHSEKLKTVNQNTKATLSGSAASSYPESMLFDQGSHLSNRVKADLNPQIGNSGQSRDLGHPTNLNLNSATDIKKQQPTFEAAAAEADLDMLLDSFSETRLLDSSSVRPGNNFLIARNESAPKGHDSSKTTSITPNIDDVLDNLLEETSNHNQPVLSQPSSSSSLSKSKVLDDFDSWLDTI
ncbi:hypothetical protein HS088_TW17G00114 [Tripterygium wilfordii]|uniref:Uncharacterized protein n=1 Tax=Tripterygium wilfordii TaxID=458696 RepID=A0A7J7CEI1_TRIWF|nr:uncharacterized protein LOC119982040 [Tripterygium wilfordii]XP_038681131.1 uncharacterized protein LOC119982040 [Tripterygium wilfordii]KAF5732584.1 hypothetical protein HS088_TW17G00114 [Tripterygium wilfordii]